MEQYCRFTVQTDVSFFVLCRVRQHVAANLVQMSLGKKNVNTKRHKDADSHLAAQSGAKRNPLEQTFAYMPSYTIPETQHFGGNVKFLVSIKIQQ